MEPKRPFSLLEWLETPPAVKQYISGLEQAIPQLTNQTQKLEKRIDELEARLNKNSRNSSKPPSSDNPFQKGKGKSEKEDVSNKDQQQSDGKKDEKPEKKKRKRGAQKGHKGHKQERLEPNRIIQLFPGLCSCGSTHFDKNRMESFYIHQQIELPEIKMDVTHIVLNKGPCLKCGKTGKAALPKPFQPGYGPKLTALIAEMSGILGDAREPIQNFCQSVLGFHISIGAIQKVIDRASEAISPIYDEIGRQVRKAPVNHIDETSFFQGGQLIWLWVMVNTAKAFFMIHAHRSKEAFLELIQDWKGILISDNYGVYKKWAYLKQTCIAHLIRKAEGLSEKKDKDISLFGKNVQTELRLLCHWAKAPPTNEEEIAFVGRLVKLLIAHCERTDEAGKLARSLLRIAKSLWLFLDEHGVEPTNNRAERALRFAVLWRKRSKGTQSEKGNRWVERILSLKETCRLHSISTYSVLVEAIDAYFKEQKPDLTWLAQ